MNQQPSLQALQKMAMAGDASARIELGNRLISEYPSGSENCLRGLDLLRKASEGPMSAPAQWILGSYYLQTLQEPGALSQAAHWLSLAADSQVPPALDRLANMHLRGLGVRHSIDRAIKLLGKLADHGFQRAAWETGYLLGLDPDLKAQNSAATRFARACALGYPPAYYSLGLRAAHDQGLAADLPFARALLLRAHDAGFPDAIEAAKELSLDAHEESLAENWYHRLKENFESSRPLMSRLMHDGFVLQRGLIEATRSMEKHFLGLNHPALCMGDDGRLRVCGGRHAWPTRADRTWQWLSERPRVGIYRQFLNREECAHIRYVCQGGFKPPEKYTEKTINGAVENLHFTGEGRSFGALTSDSVVRVIERRVAETTEWSIDRIEPCSVIRYKRGNEYRPHVDYFSMAQLAQNHDNNSDSGGQRVATFLICLVAPAKGGETLYNRSGLKVAPRPGDAFMHYNLTADGQPDEMSQHTGLPVLDGEKWLLRTTLRSNSRYHPDSEPPRQAN